MAVNFAIALQRCNDPSKAKSLLDSMDWTALCYDFRLAERVLSQDFDGARDIMIKIGKNGDFVNEEAYHIWPLFIDFRQSEQFTNGYKIVYGYSFSDKVKLSATATEKGAQAEVKKDEKAIITIDKCGEKDKKTVCLPLEANQNDSELVQ